MYTKIRLNHCVTYSYNLQDYVKFRSVSFSAYVQTDTQTDTQTEKQYRGTLLNIVHHLHSIVCSICFTKTDLHCCILLPPRSDTRPPTMTNNETDLPGSIIHLILVEDKIKTFTVAASNNSDNCCPQVSYKTCTSLDPKPAINTISNIIQSYRTLSLLHHHIQNSFTFNTVQLLAHHLLRYGCVMLFQNYCVKQKTAMQ